MRINEDYIEDIESEDIQDQDIQVSDDQTYDFSISMSSIFYNGDNTIFKENADKALFNYLEQNPLITRHSVITYESTLEDYVFSFCHAFKTPLQITRFICGLFKYVTRGLRQEIQILDLHKDSKIDETPIICSFAVQRPQDAIDKKIWLRVWQVCQRLLPDNDFTIQEIADAIPLFNMERLYDEFIVNYKKTQFDEVTEYATDIREGWVPDIVNIIKSLKDDKISYVQVLSYDLSQGEIKVISSRLDSVLMNIDAKAQFCKHFKLNKRRQDYKNSNPNTEYLFAYLDCRYVDGYNPYIREEAMIFGICVKFNESLSVDEVIDMISE